MLVTIAVILIIVWLLALMLAETVSFQIHALLVLAIVLLLVRLLRGRSAGPPSLK